MKTANFLRTVTYFSMLTLICNKLRNFDFISLLRPTITNIATSYLPSFRFFPRDFEADLLRPTTVHCTTTVVLVVLLTNNGGGIICPRSSVARL